jgi:hypothetical protein
VSNRTSRNAVKDEAIARPCRMMTDRETEARVLPMRGLNLDSHLRGRPPGLVGSAVVKRLKRRIYNIPSVTRNQVDSGIRRR